MTNRVHRLMATAFAFFGLTSSADARTLTPQQAPREWVVYAESATKTITGWLNGDEPPATRLRDAIVGKDGGTARTPPPLVLQVWVGRDGALTRVQSQPMSVPQAQQDLQTLLIGRQLPPPPKRMRQPMQLALQVMAKPNASAPTAPAGGGPTT